ncbi:MAG: ABC transporter ATP-binding protein [archaeon]|jgi:putative ABC transport system ATP-binding protein
MKSNEMIRLENVSKVYGIGEVEIKALDCVNLKISANEYVSLMGPSGSGKTTMLDVLTTMMKPTTGKVFIEGVETTKMTNSELASFRGKKIGFIFQTFNLLPKLTALENVMTPMWINGVARAEREPRARALLEEVGLGDRLNNRPNQLSGGQKQRVAIARALALDPNIIVADEPTGNLDSKSGVHVMEILKDLHKKEKRTIIVVTHDESIGKQAERRIFIKDGQVVGNKGDGNKVCQLSGTNKIK